MQRRVALREEGQHRYRIPSRVRCAACTAAHAAVSQRVDLGNGTPHSAVDGFADRGKQVNDRRSRGQLERGVLGTAYIA